MLNKVLKSVTYVELASVEDHPVIGNLTIIESRVKDKNSLSTTEWEKIYADEGEQVALFLSRVFCRKTLINIAKSLNTLCGKG